MGFLLAVRTCFNGFVGNSMGKKKISENNQNLIRFNTWYSQDKETYRKWAESKRKQTNFTQERLTEIFDKGVAYIKRQRQNNEPLTISGLQFATNCNRTDFHRMRNREYDWRLFQFIDYKGIDLDKEIITEHNDTLNMDIDYYIDEDGVAYVMEMYGDIAERFYLQIEVQLEERLYTKQRPAGAIFLLKSCFGWTDTPDTNTAIVNKSIHIATREEANKSLQELLALSETEQQRDNEASAEETQLNKVMDLLK